MTASKIRGTCEDCGKTFRVPSAERTYDCKACGGSVIPEGWEEDELDEEADEEAPAERLSQRFEKRDRARGGGSKVAWMLMGAVIVLFLAGFGMHKAGVFASDDRPPKDLELLAAGLVEDWQAGAIPAMGELYHPEGRVKFERTLEKARQKNSWEAGFPTVDETLAKVSVGTAEDPERGVLGLKFGGDSLTMNLQYDPSAERWFVTGHHLTPPPLAPRVEELREAWAESDPEALTPLFHSGSAEKMRGLVARKAEQGGWSASYPGLDAGRISGEDQARQPAAGMLGRIKVDSTFQSERGELAVRWRYAPDDYAWYVTGFDFPK